MLRSKQVTKYLQGRIIIESVTFSGNTLDVTASLTSALVGAASDGGDLTLQVYTSSRMGFVTDTPINLSPIRDSSTALPLADDDGNEIYGRLTYSSDVYTITLYSDIDGTETAYTPSEDMTVDVVTPYQFDLGDFPSDSLIVMDARYPVSDPVVVASGESTGISGITREAVTIASTNTIPSVSNDIDTEQFFAVVVNGITYSSIDLTSFISVDESDLTTIVWDDTATGSFDITSTDSVFVEYYPVE